MRPAQSSTASVKASLPARRSSIGRRRQAGSTLKNVYAMYWPATWESLAGAAGQLAVPQVGHGPVEAPHARLCAPVGVVEAGLPAVQARLVERVEDEETADGRLAVGKPQRPTVVGGLRRRTDAFLRVRRRALL